MSLGIVLVSGLVGVAAGSTKGLRDELVGTGNPWMGAEIFAVVAAALWFFAIAYAGLAELDAYDVLAAELDSRKANQSVYVAWFFSGLALAQAGFALAFKRGNDV